MVARSVVVVVNGSRSGNNTGRGDNSNILVAMIIVLVVTEVMI